MGVTPRVSVTVAIFFLAVFVRVTNDELSKRNKKRSYLCTFCAHNWSYFLLKSLDLTRHPTLLVGPHFSELVVETVRTSVAWPRSAVVPSLLLQATLLIRVVQSSTQKNKGHLPAARVCYISFVFSNARRVLSQCKTRLRLLYLINKIFSQL